MQSSLKLLTVAGQKRRLEFIESGRNGGCGLRGVRRQILNVEMRHGYFGLLIDGLDLNSRFQVLCFVLDQNIPLGPAELHFLLQGVHQDLISVESVLKVDCSHLHPNRHQEQ